MTTKRAEELTPADLGRRVRVTDTDNGSTCTGLLSEIATDPPSVVFDGGSDRVSLIFPSDLITVTLCTGWSSGWTGKLRRADVVELDPT